MVKTHRTYKVKRNDTIDSVSKNYGIETHELIAYHNERAEFHEQIRHRIPDFLQEIILPPEGYTVKDGKEVWVKDGEPDPDILQVPFSGKLSCKPQEKDLSYGVLKTIKDGEKENTIKSEISIRFYPKDEDNEFYVSVDMSSKVYINDIEADLVADELALSCTQVLYPLILQIDKNTKLLEIQNHREILDRWEKHKEAKLKYFEGDIADKYFALFEQTIIDKEQCLINLKNDWFFYLYFNSIYSTYFLDNEQKTETIVFPIIPNTAPVEFEVKKNAKIFKKSNIIRVETKGSCIDRRNKTELEQKLYFPSSLSNKPSVIGNYRTFYFLKPNSNRIQSAFLECYLELNKTKYTSISISEIDDTLEFENIRHLKSVKKQENKTSFWKSLFS